MKRKHDFKSGVLFAIGSSTGGVESLKEVLTMLPFNFPPVVVTQHMPPKFTQSFAERLNRICAMHVKEAENGMLYFQETFILHQAVCNFRL